MQLTFNINEKIPHEKFYDNNMTCAKNKLEEIKSNIPTNQIIDIVKDFTETIDLSTEQPQSANNTLNDNLIWLEQETKINKAMSIAEEARARTVALNMAVSSIKDLTAMVKTLKSEVNTLKHANELLMKKRKWLTDEEKENIRPKIIEIIVNIYVNNYNVHGGSGIIWTPDKLYEIKDMKENIYIMANVIVNHSRNERQCIRIANLISTFNIKLNKPILSIMAPMGPISAKMTQMQTGIPFLSHDYKIVYFAFYEVQHYYIKNCITENDDNKNIYYKSIEDGGQVMR